MRRIFIIAHNIRSLHNVGSIFRTADAFGAEKVFLTGYTGEPPRKEIAKVSLGAEKTVPWKYVRHPSAVIERLRRDGVKIVALEQTARSVSLANFKAPEKIAVILGNEKRGVSSALCRQADFIVAIPMLGKKESLNVSVACGIALYTLRFM